jgi:hypothetical protein
MEKRKRASEHQTSWFGQRKKRKLGKDQALPQPQIPKLEELNHTASKSIYSPLQKDSIRIVNLHAGSPSDDIRCDLEEVSLSQLPLYDALSYVWGPTRNPKRVFLNSQEDLVTQNLSKALKELRYTESGRKLWVDALCINQSDHSERNVQVPLMSSVYKNATKVIAWLGPHKNKSAQAFEFLKRAESLGSTSNWIPALLSERQFDVARSAFTPLMCRDYWSRAWIVQEIAFARKLWIQCGSDEVLYSTLDTTLDFTNSVFSTTFHAPERLLRSHKKASTQRFFSPVSHKRVIEPGSATSDGSLSPRKFVDCLLDSQCTNRRDSIFAFYNLFSSKLQKQIDIDYSIPPDEVLIKAVRAIIEVTQNLYIITIKGRQSFPKRKDAWQCYMPSWCPYFSTSFRSHSIAPDDTSNDTSIDAVFGAEKAVVTFLDDNRILKVQGFTIGVISRTLPRDSRPIEQFQPLEDDDDILEEIAYLEECVLFGHSLTGKADDPVSAAKAIGTTIQTMLAGRGDYAYFLYEVLGEEKTPIDAPHAHALNKFKSYTHHRQICSFTVPSTQISNGGVHVALVPDSARKTDIICGIFGCNAPVVLRQIGDHYEVLGGAYIHNLEALGHVNKGSRRLEDFMLR